MSFREFDLPMIKVPRAIGNIDKEKNQTRCTPTNIIRSPTFQKINATLQHMPSLLSPVSSWIMKDKVTCKLDNLSEELNKSFGDQVYYSEKHNGTHYCLSPDTDQHSNYSTKVFLKGTEEYSSHCYHNLHQNAGTECRINNKNDYDYLSSPGLDDGNADKTAIQFNNSFESQRHSPFEKVHTGEIGDTINQNFEYAYSCDRHQHENVAPLCSQVEGLHQISRQKPRKWSRWSLDEDEILRGAVESEGETWKIIAENYFFGRRNHIQCKNRWRKALQPGLNKEKWTKDEDGIILYCVDKGMSKWSEIANHLPGRLGEQAKERWVNYLNPENKKSAWTFDEIETLKKAQEKFGNRWSHFYQVDQKTPSRTDGTTQRLLPREHIESIGKVHACNKKL